MKRFVAVLLISSVFPACARIKIQDAEWCGDIGPYGAECFHTTTDEHRSIPKEQWDAERFGQLCTTPESFANWKAALLKLCKKTGMCTREEKRLIEDLGKRIETFDRKAGAL